ncbi:MAG: AAA family ATPase [Magnetococcales bacterium]|nr:AAA family ATPase [Magnetococcales bacterium]MBF0419340.1 AAA family ATPase [Magnetococcales bacterium]
MSRVDSLSIRGFKSIRNLQSFFMGNLNVLIGANGAGKSNFISLFRLLNKMYEQQLQIFVQQQGGPDALLHYGRQNTEQLHAEFHFGLNSYDFDLVPTVDNRLIFAQETSRFKGYFNSTKPSPIILGRGHTESKLKEAKDKYSPYVRESVSNWRVYHFHDTSEKAKVKQRHPSNDNLFLKIDAANLAAYLRRIHDENPDAYQRILSTIRLVAPFFGDFVHRPGKTDDLPPESLELEWTQKGRSDTVLKAHILSDGTLRFISLATLLLQPMEWIPDTILIDEPELGLHPFAISVLAELFQQVSEHRQLIVSTQSVELVNELGPEDIIVVDQVDGASTFRRFEQEELSAWLEEYTLGELWKRNILGGRP